jgi:hypothetical protein
MQDIKDILRSYADIEIQIKQRLDELDILNSKRERMTSLLSSTSYIHGGNKTNYNDEYIDKLKSEEDSIKKAVIEAADMKEYIETLVNSLKSTRQQNLIRLKYFNGHSWLSVAVHMNYSIEHLHMSISLYKVTIIIDQNLFCNTRIRCLYPGIISVAYLGDDFIKRFLTIFTLYDVFQIIVYFSVTSFLLRIIFFESLTKYIVISVF